MRYKENIEYLQFDNIKDYNEVKKYIFSKDGLITSFNSKINTYDNRYLNYSKNTDEVIALYENIIKFIYYIHLCIKKLDPDTNNTLGYINNQYCVNMRVNINCLDKKKLYDILEKLTIKIFKNDDKISYKKDADAFRVLRKRAKSSIDKDGNVKTHTVLIVVSKVLKIIDAFIKEQEFAEDLFLYKSDSNIFHFKNTKQILTELDLDYDKNKIFLLNEKNKRILAENPFCNGKFNFLSNNSNTGLNIGGRIADIAIYNSNNIPTYLSIKSFGSSITDKVHLITLKLDHDNIFSKNDYTLGVFLYSILKDKYLEAAEIYSNNDNIETIKYILQNYSNISYEYEYLNSFIDIFDSLDYENKFKSLLNFLNCPLFLYWKINPFLFINTFSTYDKNLKNNNIVEYTFKNIPVTDIKCIEDFIYHAFGTGYILIILKNRYIYIKDYRNSNLNSIDHTILDYNVRYPINSRNAIELSLKTDTFTIIGEIYASKSLWPNTISFFYYYNDFNKVFNSNNININIINNIFDEGYLLNSGYQLKRPDYDNFLN